jgi:hypothetical protein
MPTARSRPTRLHVRCRTRDGRAHPCSGFNRWAADSRRAPAGSFATTQTCLMTAVLRFAAEPQRLSSLRLQRHSAQGVPTWHVVRPFIIMPVPHLVALWRQPVQAVSKVQRHICRESRARGDEQEAQRSMLSRQCALAAVAAAREVARCDSRGRRGKPPFPPPHTLLSTNPHFMSHPQAPRLSPRPPARSKPALAFSWMVREQLVCCTKKLAIPTSNSASSGSCCSSCRVITWQPRERGGSSTTFCSLQVGTASKRVRRARSTGVGASTGRKRSRGGSPFRGLHSCSRRLRLGCKRHQLLEPCQLASKCCRAELQGFGSHLLGLYGGCHGGAFSCRLHLSSLWQVCRLYHESHGRSKPAVPPPDCNRLFL